MYTSTQSYLTFFMLVLSLISFGVFASSDPQVQLANIYQTDSEQAISDYLVSEKFDGIRAIWTGAELVTRNGNKIYAPKWFTQVLPNRWLDGELWTKRQDFSALSSIVSKHQPIDKEWQKVTYQIFDMPNDTQPFIKRANNYHALVKEVSAKHIKAVMQHQFANNNELNQYFDELIKSGAEGVMLHLKSAKHKDGRSNALLKLKPYLDDEAIVMAYLPGKGKYSGMMGALRVKTDSGVMFSIGTGFSDNERANPPTIGATITYRYHGFTKNGLPRFASFLRVRKQ
ncbi:MAG: DNA ligase [Pseudoalteromonas sp.]